MKGADGGYIYVNNGQITFVNGESVTNPFTSVTYTGGLSVNGGLSKLSYELPSGSTYISNGCGTGAGYGVNGNNGQAPYKAARYYVLAGGQAIGSTPPNSKNADVYGCGGYGGFGGAAGGSTSYYTSSSDNKNYYYYDNQYDPVGENGGKGGNGYAGCIIVYY